MMSPMPDLSDHIQQALERRTVLISEYNRISAELNRRAYSFSPETYTANTSDLREQLIAIETQISSIDSFLERCAPLVE